MRRLVVIGMLALGLAAVAAAAATASAPVVPSSVQAQIRRKAPVLAYVPTRMALGFHYRGWRLSAGALRIWFRNKAGWEITFVATPLEGSCRAGMEKSFQLDGNKVYWSHTAGEQQAWRCVPGLGARTIRLAATSSQPPTRFADVGLGRVAASGKLIA